MDFQAFVDGFQTMTCVVSVEKKDNEQYGEIRIVAANRKFINRVENPADSGVAGKQNTFIPNSLYDEYLRKNLSFEDLCCRAAIGKKPIHTYVRMTRPDRWFNIFAMPIEYEEGNLCYCTYSMEPSELTDISLLSSHSADISENVLKTCVKLHGADDFQKTMQEVIHDIRMLCDAAVCTIMLTDTNAGTCSVLATDIRPNSILKRVTQFVNFFDIAMSWLKTMGENDCLIVKTEQDMKYISEVNNPWYLTLEEAGVDSVVMFPLRYNGEVLGFIWATNFDTRNTMRIKETLELTTFFISSQIASYKMLKRLEHISYTDLLTGVQNRNAMNNRVSEIVSGNETVTDPYGIIFADLNGLKQVNDTGGHAAGDILLRKAAILLQEVFAGDAIYRAGGDEFMIIVMNCSRKEFNAKVETLHARSQDPDNVCFAIGSCYNDSGDDIRFSMHRADENMYHDKEQYYAEHPERKQR